MQEQFSEGYHVKVPASQEQQGKDPEQMTAWVRETAAPVPTAEVMDEAARDHEIFTAEKSPIQRYLDSHQENDHYHAYCLARELKDEGLRSDAAKKLLDDDSLKYARSFIRTGAFSTGDEIYYKSLEILKNSNEEQDKRLVAEQTRDTEAITQSNGKDVLEKIANGKDVISVVLGSRKGVSPEVMERVGDYIVSQDNLSGYEIDGYAIPVLTTLGREDEIPGLIEKAALGQVRYDDVALVSLTLKYNLKESYLELVKKVASSEDSEDFAAAYNLRIASDAGHADWLDGELLDLASRKGKRAFVFVAQAAEAIGDRARAEEAVQKALAEDNVAPAELLKTAIWLNRPDLVQQIFDKERDFTGISWRLAGYEGEVTAEIHDIIARGAEKKYSKYSDLQRGSNNESALTLLFKFDKEKYQKVIDELIAQQTYEEAISSVLAITKELSDSENFKKAYDVAFKEGMTNTLARLAMGKDPRRQR